MHLRSNREQTSASVSAWRIVDADESRGIYRPVLFRSVSIAFCCSMSARTFGTNPLCYGSIVPPRTAVFGRANTVILNIFTAWNFALFSKVNFGLKDDRLNTLEEIQHASYSNMCTENGASGIEPKSAALKRVQRCTRGALSSPSDVKW